MGGMGLVSLHGFHLLGNLEMLWVNNNQLKYINNLENNFRIKALYAQVPDTSVIFIVDFPRFRTFHRNKVQMIILMQNSTRLFL